MDYLSDFPLSHVGEIHLAGHAEQSDDEGEPLLIDSHDAPVADGVWEHYEFVLSRVGPIPTLIEWDSNLPEWPILKAEAAAAQTILDRRARGSLMPLESSQHELGPLRYAAAFSSALTRPDLETPSLVIGPNGKRGTKRYNVYRNNVTVSLIDALAAVFPAVQRITGVEFFRAMARSSYARDAAALSAPVRIRTRLSAVRRAI